MQGRRRLTKQRRRLTELQVSPIMGSAESAQNGPKRLYYNPEPSVIIWENHYPEGKWKCRLCKHGTSCLKNWNAHQSSLKHEHNVQEKITGLARNLFASKWEEMHPKAQEEVTNWLKNSRDDKALAKRFGQLKQSLSAPIVPDSLKRLLEYGQEPLQTSMEETELLATAMFMNMCQRTENILDTDAESQKEPPLRQDMVDIASDVCENAIKFSMAEEEVNEFLRTKGITEAEIAAGRAEAQERIRLAKFEVFLSNRRSESGMQDTQGSPEYETDSEVEV